MIDDQDVEGYLVPLQNKAQALAQSGLDGRAAIVGFIGAPFDRNIVFAGERGLVLNPDAEQSSKPRSACSCRQAPEYGPAVPQLDPTGSAGPSFCILKSPFGAMRMYPSTGFVFVMHVEGGYGSARRF